MTFKESYRKYNEEIKPEGALVERMLQRAVRVAQGEAQKGESVGNCLRGKTFHAVSDMMTETAEMSYEEEGSEEEGLGVRVVRGIFAVLKPLAAVAAVCLCLLFTLPVVADAVPNIGQLLGKISPELAEYFIPVQLSDESQGIRMEVVAINVQEEETQVYITMQDLVGERLDDTTDLYDSYSLNIPFDCVSHCQNLGYDEETKTLSFLITISAMGDAKDDWYEQIKHSRITFSVREMIGQKTEYESVEIPISLTEADLEAESMSTHLTGGSGIYADEGESLGDVLDPRPSTRVLRPGEPDERSPIKEVPLTAMGYVDGYLHIQLGVSDIWENDNHGYFFLRDEAGNERLYDGMASFFGTTDETKQIVYDDYIFDISPEELDDYTLYGYFLISGWHLEGNWKVKFTLGQ